MRLLLATSLFALAACSQPQPASLQVRAEPRAAQPVAAAVAPVAPVAQAGHGDPHAAHAAPANAAPTQAAVPGGTRRFGESLAADATRATLDQVLRTHEQLRDRTVRVEGQIVAVCQHQGCWMELRDGQTQAHVRMHGHSFFLPRDVNGKRAAMAGTIVAAHPPTECDESAREATGRVAQIEFDATGVEVYD
jgi:Domain of unknown function (DUF4920)